MILDRAKSFTHSQTNYWANTFYTLLLGIFPIYTLLLFSRYSNQLLYISIGLFYASYALLAKYSHPKYLAQAITDSYFGVGELIFIIITYILCINNFIPLINQRNLLVSFMLLIPAYIIIFSAFYYSFIFQRDYRNILNFLLNNHKIEIAAKQISQKTEALIIQDQKILHQKDLYQLRWLLRLNFAINCAFIFLLFSHFTIQPLYKKVFLIIDLFTVIYFSNTFIKFIFRQLISYKAILKLNEAQNIANIQ